MISAFGVEHGDISKSLTLDTGERVRFRSKVQHDPKGEPKRVKTVARVRKPNGKKKNIGYIKTAAGRKYSGYKTGEVEMIRTKSKYEGKGIASAMFRHAEGTKFGALHSNVQTPHGMVWSAKVPDKNQRVPKMRAAVKPQGEHKFGGRVLANVGRKLTYGLPR